MPATAWRGPSSGSRGCSGWAPRTTRSSPAARGIGTGGPCRRPRLASSTCGPSRRCRRPCPVALTSRGASPGVPRSVRFQNLSIRRRFASRQGRRSHLPVTFSSPAGRGTEDPQSRRPAGLCPGHERQGAGARLDAAPGVARRRPNLITDAATNSADYDNDIVIAGRPGRRGRRRPAVPRSHSGPARVRPHRQPAMQRLTRPSRLTGQT